MHRRDWHWEDLKARLRKSGTSLSRIAQDLGVDASLVSRALRTPVSERVDVEVARRIGVDPKTIWPSRYRADGTRLRFNSLEYVADEAA